MNQPRTEEAARPLARLAVSRAPLRDEVRRALLEALLRGDPPPGAAISEPALAADLGISRTPLRETLIGLAREGIVLSEPGRGFRVAPLTRREVEEIYPLIWTLEGLALGTAAPPGTGKLRELERLNRELREAEGDAAAALEGDRRWHHALLGDCGNQLLLETVAALKNRAFRYEYAYMRGSGRVITSVSQHEAIVEALRRGDRAGAIALLEGNWRVSVDFILPWLERVAAVR